VDQRSCQVKPSTKVKKLIAGAGVYICNECVDLCQQILDSSTGTNAQLAPWDQVDDLNEVVDHLPRVAEAARRTCADRCYEPECSVQPRPRSVKRWA
jgi:ATP-dependent protease Clp ATPase subunit